MTLDTFFDKIFYINLDEDVSRNQSMIDQFNKYGISNYERISATKLTEIPDKFYWRNFNIERLSVKYILGSLGARNSHYKIMATALERDYSKILILEDDVVFLEDPNDILEKNKEQLSSWDMLYFGGTEEPHFGGQIVCAHAYAMNRKLIEEAYFMLPSSGMEVDNFYAKVLFHMSYNYNKIGKYDIKKMNPFNTIIQNKEFESNIQSKTHS